MKTGLGVFLCIGFVLWSTAGQAETFYQYRDKSTGRDVFVNRLDQIPRKYRGQAKLVMDVADAPKTPTGDSASGQDKIDKIDKSDSSAENAPRAVPSVTSTMAEPLRSTSVELRRAAAGKNLWKDGPAIASALVDLRLVKAGTQPLSEPERAQFSRLLWTIVVLSMVAGLLAFVVWIVMIVTAVRDGHPWWALFIFLFSPLAYVYLFIHVGKGHRPFKLVCALGMLSPALVALGGVWRFYSWFHAIIQARGGHV